MRRSQKTGSRFQNRLSTSLKMVERGRIILFLRLLRKKRALGLVVLSTALFAIFVLPPSYAAHGYEGGILPAIKFGITAYLISLPLTGFSRAFIVAAVMGYGMGVIGDDPPVEISANEHTGLFFTHYALFSLGVGFVIGAGVSFIADTSRLISHYRKVLVSILVAIPLVFLANMLRVINKLDNEVTWSRLFETWDTFLYYTSLSASIILVLPVGCIVGLLIGGKCGNLIRERITPSVLVYFDLRPYLRAMAVPLLGFSLGYLLITFIFANFFWASWRSNPCCAFKNLPDGPMFGDFFYFSTVTIATLGYGDITPSSALTKTLTCIEVILGVGWITVMFAAVVAYIQPQFISIAKGQRKRRKRS